VINEFKVSQDYFMGSDIAILFVKGNIQHTYGSIGLLNLDEDSELIKRKKFTISGYPNDRLEEKNGSLLSHQIYDEGRFKLSQKDFLFYNIAVGAGTEGAPILCKSDRSNNYYAVGIHRGTD
jgi:V8-like Glu-specific endopeptidase